MKSRYVVVRYSALRCSTVQSGVVVAECGIVMLGNCFAESCPLLLCNVLVVYSKVFCGDVLV